LLETNCHCTICRRTSGAPFVTWFTVAETAFRITSGKPASFRSSDYSACSLEQALACLFEAGTSLCRTQVGEKRSFSRTC
jgi:hypothetical protein